MRFDTLLALNGICVVNDGPKFVQLAPMATRASVQTRAPKPEPGARLFDPKKVPSMGVSAPPVPSLPKSLTEAQRLEQEFEGLRQAFDQFLHPPDPGKHATQRLLVLYASLVGKTAVPSKGLDDRPIYFRVDTPLTKSELLYAIETTFTLNNLAVIPGGDRQVRLGPISEVLTNNGGRRERVFPKQTPDQQPNVNTLRSGRVPPRP